MHDADGPYVKKSESGLQVLPFYIVCDESLSMAGSSIDAVNDGIVEIINEFNADPIVDAKVRVGIVAFADNARVIIPLTQSSDLTQIPVCLRVDAPASFGNLFRLLRFVVPRDVKALLRVHHVHTPVLFILTAGKPSDIDWVIEREKFVQSMKGWVNIVSFGVAGADKSVIAEVSHWRNRTGTKFFFMAEDAGSPGAAIKEMVKFLISTGPVGSASSDQPAFQITDGATIGGDISSDGVTTYVIDLLNP